jgi:hypothetical protein
MSGQIGNSPQSPESNHCKIAIRVLTFDARGIGGSDVEEDKGPEIVFGLVGAVGTDLERVDRVLTGALSDVNYQPSTLKLSNIDERVAGFTLERPSGVS